MDLTRSFKSLDLSQCHYNNPWKTGNKLREPWDFWAFLKDTQSSHSECWALMDSVGFLELKRGDCICMGTTETQTLRSRFCADNSFMEGPSLLPFDKNTCRNVQRLWTEPFNGTGVQNAWYTHRCTHRVCPHGKQGKLCNSQADQRISSYHRKYASQ